MEVFYWRPLETAESTGLGPISYSSSTEGGCWGEQEWGVGVPSVPVRASRQQRRERTMTVIGLIAGVFTPWHKMTRSLSGQWIWYSGRSDRERTASVFRGSTIGLKGHHQCEDQFTVLWSTTQLVLCGPGGGLLVLATKHYNNQVLMEQSHELRSLLKMLCIDSSQQNCIYIFILEPNDNPFVSTIMLNERHCLMLLYAISDFQMLTCTITIHV